MFPASRILCSQHSKSFCSNIGRHVYFIYIFLLNMENIEMSFGLLSCGVFLVKSRHFGLPLAQTIRPNWQSLLAGGSVAIQTWSIYKVYT